MWSWSLEWSTIARVAIKERYILRALGFRRKQNAEEAEVGEAQESEGEESDGAASDPKPVLALPARASSPNDMRSSTSA
jgi:hypothetical protein